MEEPGAETPGAQDQDPPPGEGATPVRARPRGRTTLLIAAAAALGVIAGTCTGYLVQGDREPTALPPLSQPTVEQSRGKPPRPLSATTDRKVKTDGDLRTLLLKKPRGAKRPDWLTSDGMLDLADYAEFFEHPARVFPDLTVDEFRRGATTGWETDEGGLLTVEIRLLQFRQEKALQASRYTREDQDFFERQGKAGAWRIPGTGGGMAYSTKNTRPGAPYVADAYAWRGDIAMAVLVRSLRPVGKKTILDLATRQMERL
ncbi:hypothetical protein ACIPPJ_26685 [Streptomyces sp. NPDC086091]|uniref:hypothetical protein n=1 Tax=Streptomyces sp. NPDC086091 TaxID=3365751 RepID=UPI00382AD1C2